MDPQLTFTVVDAEPSIFPAAGVTVILLDAALPTLSFIINCMPVLGDAGKLIVLADAVSTSIRPSCGLAVYG